MFSDRSDAFDFNVALSDHEKHLRRDKDVAAARSGAEAGPASASADAPSPEVAALYRRQDLSLREGETVKCGPWAPPLPGAQATQAMCNMRTVLLCKCSLCIGRRGTVRGWRLYRSPSPRNALGA